MTLRNFITAIVSVIVITPALSQETLTVGHPPGPYRVGFKTIESYDLTRPPIREQLSLPVDQQKGRAVQVNIWYPAVPGKKKVVTLRHYLNLLTKEIDFKRGEISNEQLIDAIAVEQSNSHGIEINKQAFSQLLAGEYTMNASLDAKPLDEKFPLIIIGPETAFKWSAMAEYIASHGYVVVVTPIIGAKEKLPDYERTLFVQKNFIEAAEASIDDLQHVVSVISKLSSVDMTRVGILGYSAGVTTGLGLVTSGLKVKAVVSLEGGIGGAYGPKVLSQTASYSPYDLTAPMLHFFTPSYGYDHRWINDEYKYCDRTLVAVYPIRHEDLTTYGLLEKFSPKTIALLDI